MCCTPCPCARTRPEVRSRSSASGRSTSLPSSTTSSSSRTIVRRFGVMLDDRDPTDHSAPRSLLLPAVGRVPPRRRGSLRARWQEDRVGRRVPREPRPVVPAPRLPGPGRPHRHVLQDDLPRLAPRLDDVQPCLCGAPRARERVVDPGRVRHVAGPRRRPPRRAVGLRRLPPVAQGCASVCVGSLAL